jgi:hypothetical protein
LYNIDLEIYVCTKSSKTAVYEKAHSVQTLENDLLQIYIFSQNGGYLEVAIHEFHVGFDVPVEKIYPDVSDSWINSVIQIGRRKGPFRVG